MVNPSFDRIVKKINQYKQRLELLRDTVLSNLVMIGEIPAPTFGEGKRIYFLQERFKEYSLENISIDEAGNGVGVLPGEEGQKNILIAAHADTVFLEKIDHTLMVDQDKIVGPGVADNSLGLATLASLPLIMQQLGIRLKSNLVMVGTSSSLGRGDLEGIRFFLKNNDRPLSAGICVEGVNLGHFSISATGMLQGEIKCDVIENHDSIGYKGKGSIVVLNEIIHKMLLLPLLNNPRTSLIIGSLHGGSSYNIVPSHAVLQFEISSDSAEIIKDIQLQIEDLVAEVSARNPVTLSFEIVTQRNPGSISLNHPLARQTCEILRTLSISQIEEMPSTAELSALMDHNIPAVGIGITNGENLHEPDETIFLKPISSGIAQLLGIIMAMDEGYCSEEK